MGDTPDLEEYLPHDAVSDGGPHFADQPGLVKDPIDGHCPAANTEDRYVATHVWFMAFPTNAHFVDVVEYMNTK